MSGPAGDSLGRLIIDSSAGTRQVLLADYLDAAAEEQAAVAAHAWIKELRLVSVDGQPFRRRFLFRDDSLWWFAELYLHKQQVILEIFRTIAALERLIARETPQTMQPVKAPRLLEIVGPQVAEAAGVRWLGAPRRSHARSRIARMDARARLLMLASRASRLRHRPPRPLPSSVASGGAVAAFVHNAFWRRGSDEGSAESYIGPVLQQLEAGDRSRVRYVGVGPAANFRARRWWHVLRRPEPAPGVTAVEVFAGKGRMKESARIWRDRHKMRRAMLGSAHVRRHAVISRYDCWEIVREELAGVVLLQWPWSARAMDEAAAALDALRPAVALTYAEAGGWGRALMLECRRRGIQSAGLQHGFIYRHWLNYRHEQDEMLPDPGHPEDAGFPRPALTLLFDDYARQHLAQQGHFPPEALVVTGSPRLDALVASATRLTEEDVARARESAGAGNGQLLVLLVTKFKEAGAALVSIAEAISAMPDVQLAIKTHPAETPDAYAPASAAASNVRVLPADAPLAPLIRASRAVITVNSTVAIDAAVLGIPTLVVGLPSNLSPFVDAGVMAGVAAGEAVGPALRRLLYDEGFRLQLERERSTYLAQFGIGSDGGAAARAAAAILGLTATGRRQPAGADSA
jgi:hypothetical protein